MILSFKGFAGAFAAAATALLVLILAFGAPVAQAGTSQSDSEPATSASDPPDYATASNAFEYARKRWPDEYSGTWGIGNELHFAFTRGAEEKVAIIREAFPSGSPFIAHNFEFTEAYLFELQRRVVEDFVKLRSGELEAPHDSFEYGWVGLSVEKNNLDVPMLPYPAAFQAWALNRWGKAVVLRADPYLTPWPGTEMPDKPKSEPPDESDSGKSKPDKKAQARRKADRRIVRNCRKAARSDNAARRRFAKSRKCTRARARVQAASR